jgi:hypothetical protein
MPGREWASTREGEAAASREGTLPSAYGPPGEFGGDSPGRPCAYPSASFQRGLKESRLLIVPLEIDARAGK